jgi:hypothetical protein
MAQVSSGTTKSRDDDTLDSAKGAAGHVKKYSLVFFEAWHSPSSSLRILHDQAPSPDDDFFPD